MSVAEFSVGKSGAGGANANYITRLSAAEAIEFVKLDQLEASTLREKKTNAVAYATATEAVELAENPKARTHYRLILAFAGKVENEKAVELSKRMLTEAFPKARAIVAVHQDTDDTHAHIWIDARQEDRKKINLKNKDYEKIDETWTRIYDREFGTNHAAEYAAKKQETRDWKRAYAVAKQSGAELPKKPARAKDKMTGEKWREKALRDQGAIKDEINETESDRNERVFETQTQGVGETNRIIEAAQPITRRTKSLVAGREPAQGKLGSRIAETELAASNDQSEFDSREGQTFRVDSSIAADRTGTEAEERFARRKQRIQARRAARNEVKNFQTVRADSSLRSGESETGRAELEVVELESNVRVQLQPERNGAGDTQGRIGLHSLAAFGDRAVVAENRDDVEQSQTVGIGDNKDSDERISQPQLHDVYGTNVESVAGELDWQEDFDEEFYECEYRGDYFVEGAGLEELSRQLLESQKSGATIVELQDLPKIQITKPQLAPDNKAFVADIMQMMNASLKEQNARLSSDAEELYKTQLFQQANKPPTQTQINWTNSYNESKSEDERISIKDKSKLELTHDILTSMDDSKRNQTFADEAEQLETEVEEQSQENSQNDEFVLSLF